MEHLLEVRGVTRSFYHGKKLFTAVKDISFTVQEGESVAIVGESGSGKTTLIKMICGLLRPDRGEILLAGRRITGGSPRELRQARREMQLVFQLPQESFDPRQTLGRGIREVLVNNGVARREAGERTAALLERCGLPADYASRYPHQVSGGECQRAAIARAIALAPRLLICDEATSALDVTVQAQVMDLLGQLQREGMAILFISHDLALVQQFCRRTLVLCSGELVEEGDTEELIRHPRTDYTRRLLDAVLDIEEQ